MGKAVTFHESEDKPALMAEITSAALSLFGEGRAVSAVFISPAMYPTLVEQQGREVNFQQLYGKIALEVYGLFIFVRQTTHEGKPWDDETWFELVTEEQMTAAPLGETLIHKIVRVWESCDNQCERGFPCPLLAEIGVDLHTEPMDACRALAHIESVMGADPAALDTTAEAMLEWDSTQTASGEEEQTGE